MDFSNKNNEKRVSSDGDEVREVEDELNRSLPSLPTGFESRSVTEVGSEHLLDELWPQIRPLIQKMVAERFVSEIWPQIEHLSRQQVCKEVNTMTPSRIHSLLHIPSQKNEIGEEVITGSRTTKLKLCFLNQTASIIFTNNEIKAENGEPLQIAIYDSSNFNAIVDTGPLSSAQIELVVIDGEFNSGQRQEEACWTLTDFNKSILSPRNGRRPLIIGRDLKLCLQNGVGFIYSLIITDNSSWIKSKTFRLGARIIDERILVEFPRIGEAVSQPFRVMDHRGEVNRKHHPPTREDEVWRLEGIGKDGTYHKNLSSHGINTVGDFLKAYYEKGSTSLKKLLGKRVLDKTWKMMVSNALECGSIPTYDQSFEQTLTGNNIVMEGEALHSNFEDEFPMINFEDPPSSLISRGEASTSYEMDYTATHTQYYQGPWTELASKPN